MTGLLIFFAYAAAFIIVAGIIYLCYQQSSLPQSIKGAILALLVLACIIYALQSGLIPLTFHRG